MKQTNKAIIVAMANHKGGVGKTTTVANLAFGFAQKGLRVLCVDLDSQCNLTQTLLQNESVIPNTIYTAFRNTGEQAIRYAVKPDKYRDLSLIPSSLDMAAIEIEISAALMRESLLKKILAPFVNQYDLILLDCPPSLGLVTINALVAADWFFIPLQSQYYAMIGVDRILEMYTAIKTGGLNPHLRVGGIIFNQYSKHKTINRSIEQSVRDKFAGTEVQVLNTMIREGVALTEAATAGESIFKHAPNSNAAEDYQNLLAEVAVRINISLP
jgi:chromosome partitioning protein